MADVVFRVDENNDHWKLAAGLDQMRSLDAMAARESILRESSYAPTHGHVTKNASCLHSLDNYSPSELYVYRIR